MVSTVLVVAGAAVAYWVFNVLSSLQRNVTAAKKSGLPYYITPLSPINRIGQIFSGLWLPLWKMLPRKYWEDIIDVMYPDWHYRLLHSPFEKLGESFLMVSPGGILMFTASAEVIHQITSRREAFPKPTEQYRILAMYGENVLTCEGSMWRSHRKSTSTSFNEKNTALVFRESINQAYGLLGHWLGPDGKASRTIKSLEDDTMALMLHIIGYVGFGLQFLWPGQSVPADMNPKFAKYSVLEPPAGYSMNFKDALAGILPFQATKKAVESEDNTVKYMDQFLRDKVQDVQEGKPEKGMDIMGMLVRTSYGDQAAKNSKAPTKVASLMDSEIIGNAFIMIVAGHETTANVTHFTLLQLAINPGAQRLLQQDVDRIFGDSDPSTWDYEQCVNPLLASYVGACMNETLRTMPPAVDIPKKVSPAQDQEIVIDGERHILPREMHVGLVIAAVQHNPRYWPSQPSKVTGAENDVLDYVPERWYRKQTTSESTAEVEGADSEDFGGFAGPDTSAQLFRPVRGSYIPFSDGARSCLGRRIAQVELIATLSVIFQSYSIELAVDEWASDEEVDKMTREEKREVYQKAQDKARQTLRSATSMITLKLHGNMYIPVRLVPKGQERFVDWVE